MCYQGDYIQTTHTVNTMDDTTNYSLAQNQDTFTRGKTSGKAVPKWFKHSGGYSSRDEM